MMAINGITLILVLSVIGASRGLRCFVCLPDAATGENCRQIAGQSLQNCTSDTRHCVAVVLGDALGTITVFRGCGGHVQNFNMGSDECTMLDSRQDDLPAAYYKCKTDGCNNIEPITTEVTEVIRASPILLTVNGTVAPAAVATAAGSPVGG
ncbi:hypothetical protein RvY_17107 [Ramazzottius varieornatus]|uniref:UPAR/Ly6 domain-containing protein n=1 Tax=Ramazzottius varieornatus TaxID=947166 RepID=A0A1D1W0Z2_RAMVA|nr:hypothetical protein RvY_17107 [Ramazzottius varieornatus]